MLQPSANPSEQSIRRCLAVHSAPHPAAPLLGWLPATGGELVECDCVGEWLRHERGWSRWQWRQSEEQERQWQQQHTDPLKRTAVLVPHEVIAKHTTQNAHHCSPPLPPNWRSQHASCH